MPIDQYPIVVIQDRYSGVYSRGQWIAIASAQEPEGADYVRLFLDHHGPWGDDGDAIDFWYRHADTPGIAVGATPDEAITALRGVV